MEPRGRKIRSVMRGTLRGGSAVHFVAVLYVLAGFGIAVPSAIAGDPLQTFLGFLIVMGTLAATAVLRVLLRLQEGVERINGSLHSVRARLDELQTRLADESEPAPDESLPRIIDLTAVGRSDPSYLAAATLDRGVYPRLIRTMEDNPPPDETDVGDAPVRQAEAGSPSDSKESFDAGRTLPGAAATSSLIARWTDALNAQNLAECRRVYAALVDTTDPATAARMTGRLDRLAQRLELDLRRAFSTCLRIHDYRGALRVGARICEHFADHPIAAEFRRIEPFLVRRASAATTRPARRADTESR